MSRTPHPVSRAPHYTAEIRPFNTLSTRNHIRPPHGMPRAYTQDMTNTRTQTLRGMGRTAYRMGMLASQAISTARNTILAPLSNRDVQSVMSGWSDERTLLTSEAL